MKLPKYLLVTLSVAFYLGSLNLVNGQSVNLTMFGKVTGSQTEERFGTTMRKYDINSDGMLDLYIGAPGYSAEVGNQGAIYQLITPISGDNILSANSIILIGINKDDEVGSNFEIGDLNDDGITDIIIIRPFADNNNGYVKIFFGPFQSGTPRKFDTPDITISGVNGENFGSDLSVIKNSDVADYLLIGANGDNGFKGSAYIFTNLEMGTYISGDADVSFRGTKNFELFGETLASLGDINGDGENDIAISAVKNSSTANLSGMTYIYFGPFNQNEYLDNDADVFISGRVANTLWAGQIHAYGDVNIDGLHDFSLVSDGDQGGKLALFFGRENWPDSIKIGEITPASHFHKVISVGGSSGFGFDSDYSGDYNFDNIPDLLISAPYTSSNRGRISVTNNAGSILQNLGPPNNNSEIRFGLQVANMGEVGVPGFDKYSIDDIAVSAPYDLKQIADNETVSNGYVYFYTGQLTPPSLSLSVSPASVVEIGDSIQVSFTLSPGSRPIALNRAYIETNTLDEPMTLDSLDLSLNQNGTLKYYFPNDKYGTKLIRYYAEDDLGANSITETTLFYAAQPDTFNLVTDFTNNRVELEGSRIQKVNFETSASADSNGSTLRYDLIFAGSEDVFSTGGATTIVQTSSTPVFSLTYQDLNTILINFGYVSLGVEGELYWSVRVRNFNGTKQLMNRWAANGPRAFTFIRRGLDPIFKLNNPLNEIKIQGRADDVFSFTWSQLTTENPNAIVDYTFQIFDDTLKFGKPYKLLHKYTTKNGSLTYDLSILDVDSLLKAFNYRDSVETDTLQWYYTVKAVIDENEDNVWYPSQGLVKADIVFIVIVANEEENIFSDVPQQFEIYPNYPNPFNPVTQLKFALPEALSVRIQIFNILGQVVYNWSSGSPLQSGFHTHTLNGINWSSGIYIYQIQAGNKRLTGKMSLIK